MKRIFLKTLLAGVAATGLIGFASLAQAQDKGPIAISMPTKSSARWIADGANMVKYFKEKGYKTDLQYADNDIPNQLAQVENIDRKSTRLNSSHYGLSRMPSSA